MRWTPTLPRKPYWDAEELRLVIRKSIGIIQYLGQDGRLSRARHSAAGGTPALCGISQRLVTHAGIAHHWGAVKCGLHEPRDCEPCSLARPAHPGLELDRASICRPARRTSTLRSVVAIKWVPAGRQPNTESPAAGLQSDPSVGRWRKYKWDEGNR
jgi:hypothetical protein